MNIHSDLIPIIYKYDPRYKQQYNKVLRELVYFSIKDMKRNAIIVIESDIVSDAYTVQDNERGRLELWSIEPYYNYNFGCLFLNKDKFINGSFTIKIFYDYMYNMNNCILDVSEMIEDQTYLIIQFNEQHQLYYYP